MQDLIKNIAVNSGISTDKASEVLQTVSDFIKEKYPLLAGTVDSVLGANPFGKNSDSKNN
jgi:hypothetical protein